VDTEKIGTLFVRDYDEAIVRALGGFLPTDKAVNKRPKSSTDVMDYNGYYVTVPGFDYDMPLVLKNPDSTLVQMEVPSIHVMPGDAAFTPERGFGWGTMVSRRAAPGSRQLVTQDLGGNDIIGYSSYAVKYDGLPYSFPYTINGYAGRRQQDKFVLLNYLLNRFPPRYHLLVLDSNKDYRYFFGTMDSFADMSDVSEVSERVTACTMALTVYGKIDLNDSRFGNVSKGSGASPAYVSGFGDVLARFEGVDINDDGEYIESNIVTDIEFNIEQK
jgi:hypothetical protein